MSRLFTFWLTHRGELAVLLSQHVLLVAISTFVAIAIGLPLGIFAACLGQVVGAAVQAPQPLLIGDLNVLAASVGACSVVLAARLTGL